MNEAQRAVSETQGETAIYESFLCVVYTWESYRALNICAVRVMCEDMDLQPQGPLLVLHVVLLHVSKYTRSKRSRDEAYSLLWLVQDMQTER
jgi:hypothetical protein